MTKETPNIHQRIHAVMKDVRAIRKEDKKVNGQYRYVSHDEVARVMHDSFVTHGIVMRPSVVDVGYENGFDDKGKPLTKTTVLVNVEFINIDIPSDREGGNYCAMAIDHQDKGPGKAMSYAVKYALLKAFCLESSDEDIENNNTNFKPATTNTPEPITVHEIKRIEALLAPLDPIMKADYIAEMERTWGVKDIQKLTSLQAQEMADHIRLQLGGEPQKQTTYGKIPINS